MVYYLILTEKGVTIVTILQMWLFVAPQASLALGESMSNTKGMSNTKADLFLSTWSLHCLAKEKSKEDWEIAEAAPLGLLIYGCPSGPSW